MTLDSIPIMLSLAFLTSEAFSAYREAATIRSRTANDTHHNGSTLVSTRFPTRSDTAVGLNDAHDNFDNLDFVNFFKQVFFFL